MSEVLEELHEECGVFGVCHVEDAASLSYYGLHALQHRGQEGCGIASMDHGVLQAHKGKGLVSEVFYPSVMGQLKGDCAIGHVRYSTAGGNEIENVQPLIANLEKHKFAVVHNGQIVNAKELRIELEKKGSIFQGSSDSEVILHLIQQGKGSFSQRIKQAFQRLEGAYACLVLCEEGIFAIRDHNGLRPLAYASYQDGYLISSESCAFDVMSSSKEITDVDSGEIVWFHSKGITKEYYRKPQGRVATGRVMAQKDKESGVSADIVIGVPDSSTSAAIGYSKESGIPYELGLIKNRYVGRTFIKPTQKQRERGVRMKLSAIESLVRDKRIILIDDSIVRGTTSRRIVQLLKEAGATEVHIRIGAPAITHPCFYGVDTSSFEELISARMNDEELCEYLKADSLRFMEIDDLPKAYRSNALCTACFSGHYVTELFSYGDIIQAFYDKQSAEKSE